MKKINVTLVLIIICLTFSCKQSDQITVWTIGDSTMARKIPNTTERGWGMLFPKFVDLSQARVANYGKNGRSTKSFVDEGWWKIVLDSMKAGDFVLIQFGHNDEKTRCSVAYQSCYELSGKPETIRGRNPGERGNPDLAYPDCAP